MRTMLPMLTLTFGAAMLATGCGKQGFVTVNQIQQGQSPGSFVIQPKVDLLLLMDDSGSSIEPQDQLQAEARTFLANLQAQGWNFHFTTSSLNNSYSSGRTNGTSDWLPSNFTNQVTASLHDTNYATGSTGFSWLPPFPGASFTDPTLVAQAIASSVFRPYDRFSQFPSPGGTSGTERGLGSIVAATQGQGVLKDSAGTLTHFIRPDALLAIVAMSNGDDDSSEAWRTMTGQQRTTAMQSYANKIVSVKAGNPQLVRLYAAVAQTQQANGTCLGNNSFIGSRYNDLAAQLGGTRIDLCTQGVSGSLASIAQELQIVRQSYITRYVFLGSEPEPGTIRVTVVRSNGSTETLVEGDQNGFDYANSVEQPNPRTPIMRPTLETADGSVHLNNQTGFAIVLKGSAILRGNDTTRITYKDYGTNNSH